MFPCITCGNTQYALAGEVSNRRFRFTPPLAAIPERSDVFVCQQCGHIQKHRRSHPSAVLEQLYRNYQAGNFSMAVSQAVFNEGQPPQTREALALRELSSELKGTKRLLDVGCGVGTMLRAASALLPATELFAHDVTSHLAHELRAIPGVKDFFSGELTGITNLKFDCIVAWQSLEHMPDVAAFLREVARLLTPGGFLLVQVPDPARFPFDLTVFEHYSHFTAASLSSVLDRHGFRAARNLPSLVHNCHTVLFQHGTNFTDTSLPGDGFSESTRMLSWLETLDRQFNEAADKWKGPLAVFGTATAAGWLQGRLHRRPDCFVDEDSNRQGLLFDTVPIVSPAALTAEHQILVPLQGTLPRVISNRLCSLNSQLSPNSIVVPQEP